jgi:hypothetical protein
MCLFVPSACVDNQSTEREVGHLAGRDSAGTTCDMDIAPLRTVVRRELHRG